MARRTFHSYHIHVTDGSITVTDNQRRTAQGKLGTSMELNDLIDKLNRNQLSDRHELARLGAILYSILFHDSDVRSHFQRSIDADRARNNSLLRVRLQIDELVSDPNIGRLSALPWQLLYRPDASSNAGYFLCERANLILIRQVGTDSPPRTLKAPLPLRVLIVLSEPSDLAPILGDPAEESIREAISTVSLSVEILRQPTRMSFRRMLEQHRPNILHFMGHAELRQQDSFIALVDDQGQADWLSSGELDARIRDTSIQLVVLVACEGAAESAVDAFSGLGSRLARSMVPAVVAMQFHVPNSFAIEFSGSFYQVLADTGEVDIAVHRARLGLTDSTMFGTGTRYFGAPTLYLRREQAKLFDLRKRSEYDPYIALARTTTNINGRRDALPEIPPLPCPSAKLIGRDADEQVIMDSLNRAAITVIKGEGGIGKTALAKAVIHRLQNETRIRGGVAWLDCAAASGSGDNDSDTSRKWIEFLRNGNARDLYLRGWTLVLDSLERFGDRETLVAALKPVEPQGRVLITSRVELNDMQGISLVPIYELERRDAIMLFREVARQHGWDERRSGSNTDVLIEALCDAVGDLPLAVERLAELAPHNDLTTLLTRIWTDLDVLTKACQEPDRHETMDLCFESSLELVSSQACELLLQLSQAPPGALNVKSDEISTRLARAVHRGDTDWRDHAGELVEKSLWRNREDSYRIHPIIRRCARKRALQKHI